MTDDSKLVLKDIYVYPIKSCSPVHADGSWRTAMTGLEFDRLWVIVDSQDEVVTLKKISYMYWIKPSFDFTNRQLCLNFKDLPILKVPLDVDQNDICERNFKKGKSKFVGHDCGDGVSAWLEEAFMEPGYRLIRILPNHSRPGDYKLNGELEPIAYSSHSQYLLITIKSTIWLAEKLNQEYDIGEGDREEDKWTVDELLYRFRANFIVDGTEQEFEEEKWSEVNVSGVKFKVHAPCPRCIIVNVKNDESAYVGSEPLKSLMKLRNATKKVDFGIYIGKLGEESETMKTN